VKYFTDNRAIITFVRIKGRFLVHVRCAIGGSVVHDFVRNQRHDGSVIQRVRGQIVFFNKRLCDQIRIVYRHHISTSITHSYSRTCEVVSEGLWAIRSVEHERVVIFHAITPVSEAALARSSILRGVAVYFQAR
jgi:hypothetical protein